MSSASLVAKVWWEAPHEATLERMIFADQVVTFGRGASSDIRIGHAPLDEEVPRRWGEMYWHRGRLHVANVSDKWGMDLVSADGWTPTFRAYVAPQSSFSPPGRAFTVQAQVPGATYELHTMTAARSRVEPSDDDEPASFVPFRLTPTQKLIGAAILRPLHAGGSRRSSYQELAQSTNYALRTVRECIAEMDALFVIHDLVDVNSSGDALDRVALTLTRHSAMLG